MPREPFALINDHSLRLMDGLLHEHSVCDVIWSYDPDQHIWLIDFFNADDEDPVLTVSFNPKSLTQNMRSHLVRSLIGHIKRGTLAIEGYSDEASIATDDLPSSPKH